MVRSLMEYFAINYLTNHTNQKLASKENNERLTNTVLPTIFSPSYSYFFTRKLITFKSPSLSIETCSVSENAYHQFSMQSLTLLAMTPNEILNACFGDKCNYSLP